MNTSDHYTHTYIDTAKGLDLFYTQNKNITWLGFDTEFVGERTYFPVLCLIQVATENGNYLIDTLTVHAIDQFLSMLKDEGILKITHAGENDYRLLYQLYSILPKNVFDVQIAAGFLGYHYPISFANLLDGELNVKLDKGSSVSDWETRPISKKQLQYALNDVIYLAELWKMIEAKLSTLHRSEWLAEEFKKLCNSEIYTNIPHKEFLSSNLIGKINRKEKVFLLRLYQWRIKMAEKNNKPKERILQKKLIPHIVKGVKTKENGLNSNRLIPSHIIEKDGQTFIDLYTLAETEQEREIIETISKRIQIKPKVDAVMDMLYIGMKIICMENNIAPELVVDRARFKRMKENTHYFDQTLSSGWRRDLLGSHMIDLIKHRDELKIQTQNGSFCLTK